MEYAARLLFLPLVAVALWTGWIHGWQEVWTPAALCAADFFLAVRWRQFAPIARRTRDPGGSLGPLSKLVMVGACLLVPAMWADREWIVGGAIAVMALASAGLWLRWRWAGWVWIAYAIAAMADWLADAGQLVYETARSAEPLPMERLKPLLASLPTALFAVAVLGWVLEWRRMRASAPDRPPR